ncbi:flavodoxin family protein [Actinomadura spongiicola]|uniref:FMN dependent NADH:quinone oxidoreductase n=1 Tax=Actinomadura spongiicola TaxID=2303421 RepID=A0A372GL59_9ACTN|nr:NAD(P)H-dependent oxidoreductase [Actinomadura spongiicola]RFS85912.1 flavodoxin family protein [Actinomadura spongiicola]
MSRLLHVSASPRGGASESLALAGVFVDAYREVHGDVVDHYDLWDGTLPEFGPAAAGAKMAVFAGEELSGEQAAAWEALRRVFERFDSYDRYLFSVPMWNTSVPYILKQFVDVVSQPGWVFTFDPEKGYSGLLSGKKAAVVYTSAVYGEGRPAAFGSDHQVPFLEGWLRWAGIDDISSVMFRPNLATADAEAGRRAAYAEARELGKRF